MPDADITNAPAPVPGVIISPAAEPELAQGAFAGPPQTEQASAAQLPPVLDGYTNSASASPGATTDETTPERFPHEADAILAPPTAASAAANKPK